MQKIMFNDRYGLTQAVIEGRKTMTRRLNNLNSTSDVQVRIFAGYVQIIGRSGNVCVEKKLSYKVGEIVAVAQNYSSFYNILDNTRPIPEGAGWDNKMFVRADLMPHRIRITGIRCELLQDIQDADCLKEGVRYIPEINKFYFEDVHREEEFYFDTPREAFASLIDRVSGRGTWASNPWVVVYEFELVK